jgi:hypothetical protein
MPAPGVCERFNGLGERVQKTFQPVAAVSGIIIIFIQPFPVRHVVVAAAEVVAVVVLDDSDCRDDPGRRGRHGVDQIASRLFHRQARSVDGFVELANVLLLFLRQRPKIFAAAADFPRGIEGNG